MPESGPELTEEDLLHAARIAGFAITPGNRATILARLEALRAGVLQLNRTISDATVPAIQFDAQWGDDR